jgi:hypothetical protein
VRSRHRGLDSRYGTTTYWAWTSYGGFGERGARIEAFNLEPGPRAISMAVVAFQSQCHRSFHV